MDVPGTGSVVGKDAVGTPRKLHRLTLPVAHLSEEIFDIALNKYSLKILRNTFDSLQNLKGTFHII